MYIIIYNNQIEFVMEIQYYFNIKISMCNLLHRKMKKYDYFNRCRKKYLRKLTIH